MTVKEAKSVPIDSILSKIYLIYPAKEGRDLWYFSPLRDEKSASFKVNIEKNIWYDHGAGCGGNAIDLVVMLSNCSVSLALKKIEEMGEDSGAIVSRSVGYGGVNKLFDSPKNESGIEIIKIFSLSKMQLEYCRERGISDAIASVYLKTIQYKQLSSGKTYYSVGFENDNGGFELSSNGFKGCAGQKSITTIRGKEPRKVSVFEGFFDYLSALEHFKIDRFKGDVIILNSLSMLQKIDLSLYEIIYLFLDRDDAGIEATQKLSEKYQSAIKDQSKIYSGSKDFNEYHQKTIHQ